MKLTASGMKKYASLVLTHLFPFIVFPLCLSAQVVRMHKTERTACVIKINNGPGKTPAMGKAYAGKAYNVAANERGLFKQVSNIMPGEKVSVEIMYPSGKAGEKVVVNVMDGGKLDNNKGVKVLSLNHQNKCLFGFKLADDAGLYRLLVRKGNDTKVVQLWVGKEAVSARK